MKLKNKLTNPVTLQPKGHRLLVYQNTKIEYPQPNEIWKHYKGGKYQIVAMCNHTETDEILVIYKSLSFGGFHARPFSQWYDVVKKGEDGLWDTIRFTKITYEI
jgi:hypothetical protein